MVIKILYHKYMVTSVRVGKREKKLLGGGQGMGLCYMYSKPWATTPYPPRSCVRLAWTKPSSYFTIPSIFLSFRPAHANPHPLFLFNYHESIPTVINQYHIQILKTPLLVIRSVTDVLRVQSRFVKFVGDEAAGRPPPPLHILQTYFGSEVRQ